MYTLASNLPSPYLDTRLDDSVNEVAYTIGSSRADLIAAQSPNWYYTIFFTDPGNVATDKHKLQAQFTTEYSSGCAVNWSTFCLFSDTNIPVVKLIPFADNVPTSNVTGNVNGFVRWMY